MARREARRHRRGRGRQIPVADALREGRRRPAARDHPTGAWCPGRRRRPRRHGRVHQFEGARYVTIRGFKTPYTRVGGLRHQCGVTIGRSNAHHVTLRNIDAGMIWFGADHVRGLRRRFRARDRREHEDPVRDRPPAARHPHRRRGHPPRPEPRPASGVRRPLGRRANHDPEHALLQLRDVPPVDRRQRVDDLRRADRGEHLQAAQ